MSKKFKIEFEDDKAKIQLDPNEDGESLLFLELNLKEAFQEAFDKGEKVEGVSKVELDFSLKKLTVQVDTDQDGMELLKLDVDIAEALDEIFDKKDEEEEEEEKPESE